jgi:hypothetical protein
MNVKKKISMRSIGILLGFVTIISLTGSSSLSVFGQNNADPYSTNDNTVSKKRNQDIDVNIGVELNNLKIEHVGGPIASLQTDSGKTWVTSGKWDLQSAPSNASANSKNVNFNATIDMRGTDNSGERRHKISAFILTNNSVITGDEGSVLTFNGTATIKTPSGLFTEVPISIKLMDSGQVFLSTNPQSGVVEPKWIPKGGIISLTIDGQKINEHFGSSPVYGTVRKE